MFSVFKFGLKRSKKGKMIPLLYWHQKKGNPKVFKAPFGQWVEFKSRNLVFNFNKNIIGLVTGGL